MPPIPRPGACRHTLQLAITLASLALLAPQLAAAATLKLASWNLEWFVTPATFHSLQDHCTGDEQAHRNHPRSIPCDVAARLERSATDIAALAAYARRLDADVVALQEVDGPEAARQLFPQYEFCFTGSTVVQNTGFAIRRGLPYRCGADLEALSLGEGLRPGATVRLYPGTRHELHLLAVHLKSGCTHGPFDAHQRACVSLLRQGPPLQTWLEGQARAAHRYVVLGDFNRDLLAEMHAVHAGPPGPMSLWAYLDGSGGGTLLNTATGAAFHNCYAGQRYRSYIDYILLSGNLESALVNRSFERLTYAATDAWRFKLSDHCPVAVRLQLD